MSKSKSSKGSVVISDNSGTEGRATNIVNTPHSVTVKDGAGRNVSTSFYKTAAEATAAANTHGLPVSRED